jgi:hypothetical protein
MAKTKDLKIKDEQLAKLQGLVNQINSAETQLGRVEAQKYEIIGMLPGFKKELSDFQVELEEEYGRVSISVVDGTIKEIENETDQKD